MAYPEVSYKALAQVASTVSGTPCAVPLPSTNKFEDTQGGFFYLVNYEYDCNEPAVSVFARFDDGYFSSKAITLVGDSSISGRNSGSFSQFFIGVAPSFPFMVSHANLAWRLQSAAGERINTLDRESLLRIAPKEKDYGCMVAFPKSLVDVLDRGFVFGFDKNTVAIEIPYGLDSRNAVWSSNLRKMKAGFNKQFGAVSTGRVKLDIFCDYGPGRTWVDGLAYYIKTELLPTVNDEP